MSVIEEYVKDLEKFINQIPYRLSTKIHAENRGDIALYLRGKLFLLTEVNYILKNILSLFPN